MKPKLLEVTTVYSGYLTVDALQVRLSDGSIEEACAGMISEAGQDAEATARREAYEELGVRLASLELVSRVWSSPGVSSERVSLFLAPYVAADRVSDARDGGRPGPDRGQQAIVASIGATTSLPRAVRDLAYSATSHAGGCPM
jgi:ADP-ribose pyrophosphatase YjhB (NUDIX family)